MYYTHDIYGTSVMTPFVLTPCGSCQSQQAAFQYCCPALFSLNPHPDNREFNDRFPPFLQNGNSIVPYVQHGNSMAVTRLACVCVRMTLSGHQDGRSLDQQTFSVSVLCTCQ